MMRRRLLVLFSTLSMSAVSAAEFAFLGGAHSTDADSTQAALSVNGRTGWHLGALGLLELQRGFVLRSGAVYSFHQYDLVAAANTHEIELSYLQVPVTAMYLMQDSFGFFAGPQLALNLSDDCTGTAGICAGQNTENLIWSAVVGGHFRFAPNWGAEIAYSRGFSKVNSSSENLSSVAFSLLFLY